MVAYDQHKAQNHADVLQAHQMVVHHMFNVLLLIHRRSLSIPVAIPLPLIRNLEEVPKSTAIHVTAWSLYICSMVGQPPMAEQGPPSATSRVLK
jgi:hypothetical protein